MRKSPFILPLLLVLLGTGMLLPADRMTRRTRAEQTEGRSGTPWVRYVMVGLGGFRGVISEVLWVRADQLQHQGRYMELVQLSDWITALDPRATDGWTFNAWNLAYNISAMLPDPRARLPWVRAGISLLRDKAIPANPGSARLHKELGWLYQDKIGSENDPAHLIYKLDLAAAYHRDGSLAGPAEGQPHPYGALSPDQIRRIEERFGTIDWRLADAHALYWAWKGLELHPTGYDEQALRRMVQQTLGNMVFAGRFIGDTSSGVYRTAPALELLPGLEAFFEETIETYEAEAKIYAFYLARMIPALAVSGQGDSAKATYRKLDGVMERMGMVAPTYDSVASGAPLRFDERPHPEVKREE